MLRNWLIQGETEARDEQWFLGALQGLRGEGQVSQRTGPTMTCVVVRRRMVSAPKECRYDENATATGE